MSEEIELCFRVHRQMPVDFAKHETALAIHRRAISFSMEEAEEIWKRLYGRPYKGSATRAELRLARKGHYHLSFFFLPPSLKNQDAVPAEWKRLHESLKAQRTFAKKMVRVFGRYPLTELLWGSMCEYYGKFFALFPTTCANSTKLVPTLFIDFVWHTHLGLYDQYVEDCRKIAECVIDHDDSIKADTLSAGLEGTRSLWQERYGECYIYQVREVLIYRRGIS